MVAGRKQFVKIDDSVSNAVTVGAGTPHLVPVISNSLSVPLL